ncbi:MAG TPA: hypothetical protein PLC52_09480 [Anaerolineales bacterium]|nr:hypothetical protein [Anaerolineales bacterium]HRQ93081.1 hypothetical protein [Anaerolineales bacterium]
MAQGGAGSAFLTLLSNPARSALEHAGITTLNKLAKYTEKEILALHGIGPASMPTLCKALKDAGLAFRK